MKKPTPFGKYYLLERINVGGMAEVFRAKAFGVEGFERLVAVKRILPNIAEDKEFIRMFIDEAKLAVQLNHANIAQIFDLGVVDGSYYIALEHVHGRDLRAMFDRCRQAGDPMPVSQACFCVMKICEGLDYAHNKRDQGGRELHLVHRDVSPQNVLVSFEGEVKLIDFGIAKAAGKGSKTQAGILKGKFGYMSPEQVRGMPLDRRSDVFSCGIVLYEMLTGERLFVGESDFSTLEKVRNVEILPPSTYNRRIPDELERIVLKALAKDVDERYQNAIDLHDELQAFVYTAGEFYSRKDLAGWMKKTFGREIEEETAKLESYRQLKAPSGTDTPAAALPRPASGTRPPTSAASPAARRSSPTTGGQKAAAGSPPPPPRLSQSMPTIERPKVAKPGNARLNADALAWDDEELETQIYDNPEDKDTGNRQRGPRDRKPSALPLAAPATPAPQPTPPLPAAAAKPPTAPPPISTLAGVAGPDLSSLVSTGKGWGEATKPPPALPTIGTNGAAVPPPQAAMLANGSSKGPTPVAPVDDPLAALAAQYAPPPASAAARELTPGTSAAFFDAGNSFGSANSFGAANSFGQGMLARGPNNNKLYLAIGGAAIAVIGVIVIIASTGGSSKKPAASVANDSESKAAIPAVAGDQNTGFDLYVQPAGTMTWRLDGEARTDRLPSRIRGITPGKHVVAVDAPAGFMSQNMPINVELGKAPKVDIVLQPLDISGTFTSTPEGAMVWLIVDGKRQQLGPSPAHAKLDPRKTYQVTFEKTGFVSVSRPIVFTGAVDEPVDVTLEKAGTSAAAAVPETPVSEPKSDKTEHTAQTTHTEKHTGPVTHPEKVAKADKTTKVDRSDKSDDTEKPDKSDKADKAPEVKEAVADTGGTGTLRLGSKPPCEIFVDGKSTGLSTPQPNMKLSAGKHKITLVNNEYGITEKFTVEIKADQVEKQMKDYSDRLPK